ncbi:uncharacterized protein LOC142987830 [Anticarsia gemmatalis]|uniref:uncharacterized protein LOC142987830 n=1 Tax=Anticarsia gemmatalis TaxID=129554 RepID=UPI003F7608B4
MSYRKMCDLTENLLELWAGMLDLTRDVFWNPRAKFIVQINYLEDKEGIEELFKIMLKYKIYDVILLHSSEDDATIYTYHPFENNNCGKHFDKVVNLGTCENAENITNFFPNNIPDDLRNCTIKVVAVDDVPNFISKSSNYTVYGKFVPGLEQYVLDTIASREGFFIDYEIFEEDEIDNGIVLPNQTTTGLLNYIDRDKADVAAGGYVLMKNRVELFDYLYGFNYASYNLYTPVVRSHAWRRVYREFGLSTWLLIGAALVVVIIVSLILRNYLKDRTCSILNIWGYFFGNANAGLSRNINFRMIIFCWSWFTFFISNFYNTALVSLISVHVHESPHSISAENFKSLPFKPCISENARMFFQFAYNQKFPEGEPIHNCTYTDGALQYVATTKKYYAIEMEYSYSLKEYEYMNDEGKHMLESWIFSSTNVIVIYLVRGFPFRDKFQKYATRMYEAGLIKTHLKTIHLRSYSVIKRHPKTFKTTSILDLSMHFCILISGQILSFICFLLEIWYHYVTQEEKVKRKTK